jgi:hypothetical protein
VQVLNIKHKLHVRKILISRDKLKPLSQQEKKMMQAVEIEVRTFFHPIGPIFVCTLCVIYVCMYIYVEMCAVYMHECMHACLYLCMNACMHIRLCTYVCLNPYILVCLYNVGM